MSATPRKGRITAAFLAIFLGAFGVHRFYLGKWWGIFYLLFCWTMIPTLIGLLEGLIFMLADDKAWDDRYNHGEAGEPPPTGIGCIVLIAMLLSFIMQTRYAIVGFVFGEHWLTKSQIQDVEREGWRISKAVSAYYMKNGTLPADVAALQIPLSNSHINRVTVDPKTGLISLTMDVWNIENRRLNWFPYLTADGGFAWGCYSPDEFAIENMTQNCRGNPPHAYYDFSRPPHKTN